MIESVLMASRRGWYSNLSFYLQQMTTTATLLLLLLTIVVVSSVTDTAASTPLLTTTPSAVVPGGFTTSTVRTAARIALVPRGGYDEAEDRDDDYEEKETTTCSSSNSNADQQKWSSLLTVNPKHILRILTMKGGLLIPKDSEQHVERMRQVMDVKKAQLNIVERELILYNFTLSLPPNANANQNQQQTNSNSSSNLLRIGKVRIRWDAYTEPCLDIEVDQVDVLVEFRNLILSKSNWNELLEYGFSSSSNSNFPPEQAHPGEEEFDPLSFIRFNTIDLSKNLTVRVLSQPLQKEIGTFTIDLDLTDRITELIRTKSEDSMRQDGNHRRGCTLDEVVDTIREYVGQSIQNFVTDRLKDLATKPLSSIAGADRVLCEARGSVLRYAEDAIGKTGEDVHENVASKLAGWGIKSPEDKLRLLKEHALYTASRFNITASSIRSMLGRKLDGTRTVVEDTTEQVGKAFADNRQTSDEIWFPDW